MLQGLCEDEKRGSLQGRDALFQGPETGT